jgi:endonuclease YncB( thermonuclease family)
MFGWRKRSEGFEWQEYVRTTILVRRADRQRRIDDAREAAIEKVQHVKDRGLEVGKASVDLAAEKAAGAAKAAGRTLGDIAVASAYGAAGFVKSAGDVAVKIVKPYLPERKEPEPGTEQPVHERYAELREQRRKLERKREPAMPKPPRKPLPLPDIGPRGRMAISYAMRGAVALGVVLAVGHMLQSGSDLETGSVTRAAAITTEPIELQGRAAVIAGDTLRLNGQIVKLSGVEAPEDNQPCFYANGRRWSCSAAARKALDRLVRGKRVVCAPSGADDSGYTRAACQAGGEDLAKGLILAGHVFAETGMFATYRADEDAARESRAGVWQGEAVRPSEWRARIWEEAKSAAPDGCPIKGVVRSGEPVYTVPWSNDYNGARFRAAKAERWFCSEREARDAGFKSSWQ